MSQDDILAEPVLQLLDAVRETATASTKVLPDPVRDPFLPAIRKAGSVAEFEEALHATTDYFKWLWSELAKEIGPSRSDLQDRVDRTTALLLDSQDGLRDSVAAKTDDVAAEQALVAQETFRRFLREGMIVVATTPQQRTPPSLRTEPAFDFVVSVVLRLALLLLAIEQLTSEKPERGLILRDVAAKAFETSQLLRGQLTIDLTPWVDVPELRALRIAESASSFWGGLSADDRKAVSEAWAERVDLTPRWP